MKKKFSALLLAALLLAGCGAKPMEELKTDPKETELSVNPTDQLPEDPAEPVDALDPSELFSNRDYKSEYDAAECIRITFEGSSAECADTGVAVAGSVITITEEGTYLLTGNLDDGTVIVDADKKDKVQLVLENASIHSQTCAAIYVRQADKVFLTLSGDNSLSNGGSFTAIDENNIDAALFSKDDLTINGEGKLQIISPAGHGIVSKDELTLTGGALTVDAASHGITGQDCISIDGATLTVTSGKDALQADGEEDASKGFVYIGEGSLSLNAQGDGVSASSAVQIDGGTFYMITGGGSANAEVKTSEKWGDFGGMGGRPGGMGGRPGDFGGQPKPGASDTQEDSTSIKGIKSGTDMVINGGSFSLDCADDALHSNGNLMINGGSFAIATGDDGLHADETLTVNGGSITISQSYEGLEGLCVLMTGGNVTLCASDDGMNAAGGNDQSGFGGHRGGDMFGASSDSFITVTGGTLFVDAAGDGIDSNGDLTITGGTITVEGPTDGGNGPLDYGGNGSISGGTVIVTGSMQMAQSLMSDGQGVLAAATGNQPGGTAFEIRDAEGNVILKGQPRKAYACIVASCPKIAVGETYTLLVGSLSGEMEAQ